VLEWGRNGAWDTYEVPHAVPGNLFHPVVLEDELDHIWAGQADIARPPREVETGEGDPPFALSENQTRSSLSESPAATIIRSAPRS